jgi:hypothetical protein
MLFELRFIDNQGSKRVVTIEAKTLASIFPLIQKLNATCILLGRKGVAQ